MNLSQRELFAIACDCCIFAYDKGSLWVALIERKNEPFAGDWALPGGFVEKDETLEECARRELKEETAIDFSTLEAVKSYSAVDRDPRGRVVSMAYMALVRKEGYTLSASVDATKVSWFPIDKLPKLAFDHNLIFSDSLEHLRRSLSYRPIGRELLAPQFTLSELQSVYEAIWGKALDKRNFRRKVSTLDYIIATGEKSQGGKHRPAELYRFDEKKYQAFVAEP